MFILDPANNTLTGDETRNSKQLAARKHKYSADVPISDEAGKKPLTPVTPPIKLKSILMGLIKQKHWIYFLNQDIQLRSEHLPVLQVRLKEHHVQSDCIERITLSGHCSAIIIEKNQMDEAQTQRLHTLCIKHEVQLIFLENLKDNGKLH